MLTKPHCLYALCSVLYHTVEPVGCWAMRAPLTTRHRLHTDTGHLMDPTILPRQATASLLVMSWPRGSGVPQPRGLRRGNRREQFLQPVPERCLGRRGARMKPQTGEVALVGHRQPFGHGWCLCSCGQLTEQGLGRLCCAPLPRAVFLRGIKKLSFALRCPVIHHISCSSSWEGTVEIH